MSRTKNPSPHRCGHRYQYEEYRDNLENKKIKRIEAVSLLLGIIKKLNLIFFRSLNPFQGGRYRFLSPEKAREIVRKVYQQNNCNISKTAKILGISRKTVRRALNGPLNDLSKKPHSSPNKTPPQYENLIVSEAERTGFSYRRLKAFIEIKYSISISENTIKNILRRNNIRKTKRKRTKSSRHLYDYEALLPFQEFQLDTKHLLDKNSLPPDVYNHMIKYNLPQYEWNIIDVKTRTRFTAYSYELNSTFGFSFIIFVVLWLRKIMDKSFVWEVKEN